MLLASGGIENPSRNGELLLGALLDFSQSELLLHGEAPFPREKEERLRIMVQQRLEHTPLAYILGEAFFYGRPFKVGPGCLIPRPETELLVEEVLPYIPREGRVVDWGTGSGCIVETLALERPDASYMGVEVSPSALEWARRNLSFHGLEGKVTLCQEGSPQNIPWQDSLHVVVSNPPYIPRKDLGGLMEEVGQEPVEALDGGADGLDLYRLLLPWAEEVLVPLGILAVEIGDASQVEPLLFLGGEKLVPLNIKKDYNGLDRIMVWQKKSDS